MSMRIEHVGFQVKDPAAMADWYAQHLGFTVRRGADMPAPVRFIADAGGRVMLEIYRNPSVPVPDYAAQDPLTFHIAFLCDDVRGTTERLVQAGASVISGPAAGANGDEIATLRDPWGVPIQFCRRQTPMVPA